MVEKTVRVLEYDMSDFLRSCCEKYEELATQQGVKVKWETVDTPFIEEPDVDDPARDAHPAKNLSLIHI